MSILIRGEVIFQAKCAVTSIDTAAEVASKVHALEYEFFPKVIEEVLLNKKDISS